MTDSIFEHMHMALEAKEKSPHPTHKVGALICGYDNFDNFYATAHANHWPPILEKHIGRENKLGGASTTVHAEVAAILHAPATDGADLYVTELPCPNCAKIIAESRLNAVYIDSQTHLSPLGKKLAHYFTNLSQPILENAGIDIFEVNRNEHTVTAYSTAKKNLLRPIEKPVLHIPLEGGQINPDHFMALIQEQKHIAKSPFAACYAKTMIGQYTFLCAQSHRSIGLSEDETKKMREAQDKYTPTIAPINRLLLTCARYGLKIDENYLYSSQIPSSREFVNLIGADICALHIGDKTKFSDPNAPKAVNQILDKNLITLKFD